MIKQLSWEEIKTWLTLISEEVKFMRFDFIYGVPRGGLIPAVILSRLTNIPLITDYSDETGLHKYASKKVLFVDDVVRSGKTFHYYEGWIDPLEGYLHEFICLVKNNHFLNENIWKYGFSMDKDEWTVFPWEKELSEEEVQNLLQEHSEIA